METKLNIGCGTVKIDGYINVDLHNPDADMIADAHALPYGKNTVDEIYSSHLLEHFAGSQQNMEVLVVLKEWCRVLKPGGKIKVEVPNLEWCVRNWLEKPEAERWQFALDTIYGMETHPGEYHKTGFSVAHLHCYLHRAGFIDITITDIWSHDQSCYYAEAVKP
jgi:predicted SAM-dependent methyltransferase